MVTRGTSVRVAEPDLVGSATLVAVTVTTCWALTMAGEVYKPAVEIVPRSGLSDHVTDLSPGPPVTVAVNCSINCWGLPGAGEIEVTLTETVTDISSVMLAV